MIGTSTLVRAGQLRARQRGIERRAAQLAVFAVAVGARLSVILRHGGLHGNYGYDAGVYFAGGDAFVHGRLPYRDFVLIHPPGLMLLLSPFARLTGPLSDESAFTLTILAFVLLGGVNAVLVVRVALRLGLRLRAASAAGLFYAVWYGSIGSEYLIKLEPAGNLFFLLGLLAALRCRRDDPVMSARAKNHGHGASGEPNKVRLRWPFAAGAALGATVTFKIWWIVPLALAVLWLGLRLRSWVQLRAVVAGVVLVNLLVDGPFFVRAPRAMWDSVVTDQVGRPPISRSPIGRLSDLSTVPRLTGPLTGARALAVVLALLVVTGWVVRRAWGVRAARPAVVLLLVQGFVLLWAPSWFAYYADFIAVPAALCVGAAAVPRAGTRRHCVPAGWLVVAMVAAVTAPVLAIGHHAVRPFRGAAALARATSGVPCVLSDSPMGLIELNALSRNLGNGCRNWVDVTGRTYGPDRADVPRVRNLAWQRDLTAYLRSGGAVILVRAGAGGTGVAAATRRAISRDGVLARAGGHVVYRVSEP